MPGRLFAFQPVVTLTKGITMSKSNVHENEYMLLMFNNIAAAGIGNAAGLQPSAVAGNFYLALHTADPGEAGNQSTSETTYTGYARIPVARTAAGFTVTANAVNLVANADFGACTANPGAPVTHFSIGDDAAGAGKVRYKGPLAPAIAVAAGVIPRITTAANLVTEE
jgi:hypothetical protein